MIGRDTGDIILEKFIVALTIYGAVSLAFDLKKLIMWLIHTF